MEPNQNFKIKLHSIFFFKIDVSGIELDNRNISLDTIRKWYMFSKNALTMMIVKTIYKNVNQFKHQYHTLTSVQNVYILIIILIIVVVLFVFLVIRLRISQRKSNTDVREFHNLIMA